MDLLVHPSAEVALGGLQLNRTASILLHGPAGVGTGSAALALTRRAVCEGCDDSTCAACRRLDAGTHENVLMVVPDEKGKIGIEAIHELAHNLSYRQSAAGPRVAVIDDADTMTLAAQNALLKTLEEPPEGTLMVLTAHTAELLLPTIRSRVQALYLAPPGAHLVTEHLVAHHDLAPGAAAELAAMSGGLPALALRLNADLELRERFTAAENYRQRLTGGRVYERLQAAYELSKLPALAEPLLASLHRWSQTQLRRDASAEAAEAVQRLQERLRANVAPKTAFEALALEIPC